MMGRIGAHWQVVVLVPLVAAIAVLAWLLRPRASGRRQVPLPRFVVVSVLAHVGLLFVLDLILVSIPVVEAHREWIETVMRKTFSLPTNEATERHWSAVADGPPPSEPATESASPDAAPTLARGLAFAPELRGLAASIPDSQARDLAPGRVLFVPREGPGPAIAPADDLPRAVSPVASPLPAPEAPEIEVVLTPPDPAPEPRVEPAGPSPIDPPVPAPDLNPREMPPLALLHRDPIPLEPPMPMRLADRFRPDVTIPAPALPAPRVGPAEVPVVPRDAPDLMASLALRRAEVRKDVVSAMGGNEASETAVRRGLEWLVAHQADDGRWGLDDLHCRGHRCETAVSMKADAAASGLALMALLGAGHAPGKGAHAQAVERGARWLVAHQEGNGNLAGGGETMYGHALATIALCEAFALSGEAWLREPAARALKFIAEAQDPGTGGWRYAPRGGGDTSVLGWQLMALKSGEMAGLPIPSEVYSLAGRWLDSVRSGPEGSRYAYKPGRAATPPMTAEALLCRQYLGMPRDAPAMRAGGDYLLANPPDWKARNSYYWYYATQVMFHLQGGQWASWNARLRDMLVEAQAKDGPSAGSWHPQKPTTDSWSDRGGRLYETTLSLLMLEVYYRHLPLYQQLGK